VSVKRLNPPQKFLGMVETLQGEKGKNLQKPLAPRVVTWEKTVTNPGIKT